MLDRELVDLLEETYRTGFNQAIEHIKEVIDIGDLDKEMNECLEEAVKNTRREFKELIK